MTFPVITVECAFTTDPLTTPGAWTDISAYVRGIDINRGRQHELSRSQAGRCSIRLTNTDRRFDPSNTAGTYYPNVIPMRRIRVRAVHNAVTYDLFQGYVENWGQTWPGRVQGSVGDAEVTLEAVDAFKLLSLFQVSGAYVQAVLGDSPIGYWRMNETGGATSMNDSGSANMDLDVGLNAIPGYSTSLPLAGQPAAVNLMNNADFGLRHLDVTSAIWPTALTTTVEFWARFPIWGASSLGVFIIELNDGAALERPIRIDPLSVDVLTWEWNDGSGPYFGDSPPGYMIANDWHHYAMVRSGASGNQYAFYRDGVLIGTDTGSAGASVPTYAATADIQVRAGAAPDEWQLAHLAIYNEALSASQIAAHYLANIDNVETGYAGTQIDGLLDAFGWPTGERDIDVGQSQMQSFTGSSSLLEILLNIAEDSERGLFQVRGDGTLVFHDRATMRDHTSQGTFGDSGAEFAYADLVLRYDDNDLYSRVIASRDNGGTITLVDDTAAGTYGPRTLSISGLILASDADLDSLARSLLARYSAPYLRPVSMQLVGSGGSSDALWAQILGRETHHDKVTVLRRPPGGGATITLAANIEGIHHSIIPAQAWEVTYDLVPDSGAWILEDDVWGLLEETTVLAW